MAARKRKEAVLLEEARVLAERSLMVRHRHDVLQVIMRRASPSVRKRLHEEALVRQDEFLEALYAGAKFADLDEEAKTLVSPSEGVPPPALAAPPLSPFMHPVVYDDERPERFEFEWLWEPGGPRGESRQFEKVIVHREAGIENRAIRVDIRVGDERVAMGVVFTPLPGPEEHTGMWARLYVLRPPRWPAACGARLRPVQEEFRRLTYLWCVLMAGYEVEYTEMALGQDESRAETALDRMAEDGLIELTGTEERRLVCKRPVLKALR